MVEPITKKEFIKRYCERSGCPEAATASGMKIGDWRGVALPCRCGDDSCHGWAMVDDNPAAVSWHISQNRPTEATK